jgi:hypothetical protein
MNYFVYFSLDYRDLMKGFYFFIGIMLCFVFFFFLITFFFNFIF